MSGECIVSGPCLDGSDTVVTGLLSDGHQGHAVNKLRLAGCALAANRLSGLERKGWPGQGPLALVKNVDWPRGVKLV
jgi:hypothetical protein